MLIWWFLYLKLEDRNQGDVIKQARYTFRGGSIKQTVVIETIECGLIMCLIYVVTNYILRMMLCSGSYDYTLLTDEETEAQLDSVTS